MIRLFSRKVISIVTVFVLIMGIAAGVPGLHFEVSADSVYEISLNTAVATVGEKTEFTATVKIDGTQVTDLAGSGLALYWWNTTGDCALDSSEGLANSATFSSSGDINLRLKLMSTSDWSTLTEVYPKITVSEASSEGYSLKLSQTEATVAPGQSVDLSATVKSDGQTVSDLSASGLHLWWWTDSWNSHSTGNSDAVYSNYDSNSGNSLAATVTFPTAGTYYICAELKDASSDVVDPVYVTVTVTDSSSEEEGYSLSLNKTEATVAPGQSVDLSATVKSDGQTVSDLSASGLHLWWWTDSWNSHSTGNSDAVYSNYDSNSGNSLAATVTFPTAGTYYICAELKDASSDVVDPVYITVTVEEDTAVKSDINVAKVSNLSSDFILGVDISSAISEFDSGVVYYDYDGNKIGNISDFCVFLKSMGINTVRIRVWNDPYDSEGNGYGGGDCDVAKAKLVADACENAGLNMLVDFHVSDFWCDPSKQTAPKEWSNYTLAQKQEAIENYILESLNTIDPNKNTVTMVQVGNETNSSFCGESSTVNMCKLFASGAQGVRSFSDNVKVVIHVTNPEKSTIVTWAANLANNNVDYDVIATSYYPYWHGSLDNLESVLNTVRTTYKVDVMVAETSYAYTLEDSDGHSNTVREGNNDSGDNLVQPFTVQGQATAIRNVVDTVNKAGGIGVFYWEPAWITVGNTQDLTGDEYDSKVAANKALWEANGSGWASSYAGEYDSEDAGKWYGGSAVDNEAMFYPDGTPTASLKLWKLLATGAVNTNVTVESIADSSITVEQGGTYILPQTCSVSYNSGVIAENVSWLDSDLAKIDISTVGTYEVSGVVTLSKNVNSGTYAGATTASTKCTVTVKAANLITDKNDAGLESGTNFTVAGSGMSQLPYTNEPANVYDGSSALHWYSSSASTGTLTYNTAITLNPGVYRFEAETHGEKSSVALTVSDSDGNIIVSGDSVSETGWLKWQSPYADFTVNASTTVTLSATISIDAGGWGILDALYLHQTSGVVLLGSIDSQVQGFTIDSAYISENIGKFFTAEELSVLSKNQNAVLDIQVQMATAAEVSAFTNLLSEYTAGSQIFSINVYKTLGGVRQRVYELPAGINVAIDTGSQIADQNTNNVYLADLHNNKIILYDGIINGTTACGCISTFSPVAVVYKSSASTPSVTPTVSPVSNPTATPISAIAVTPAAEASSSSSAASTNAATVTVTAAGTRKNDSAESSSADIVSTGEKYDELSFVTAGIAITIGITGIAVIRRRIRKEA